VFPPDTKILVVEDTLPIREIITSFLRNLGFQNITEADDVAQALKHLATASEKFQPYQLIISDWKMPGMTGMDLLNSVRRKPEWTKIPFVFLTSESRQDQIIRAVQAGANNYILKPLIEDTLRDKLRRTWDQLQKAGPQG
jgi:two-component system, chemotaxis family, chemotaxis protein CheY